MILALFFAGYSYSGDPGVATGYGRIGFDAPYDGGGWLVDNSAQHNRLIVVRQRIGFLPGAVEVTWSSNSPGYWWQGQGRIAEAPMGWRQIEFDGPAGRVLWIVQPEQ